MKVLSLILKKIGWSGIIMIVVAIILLSYAEIRKSNRENNAIFCKGVSLGLSPGVRGSIYLYYSFEVGGDVYNGNMKRSFCEECPRCCIKGDTVIVRYERNNPKNSDLVKAIPAGEHLDQ